MKLPSFISSILTWISVFIIALFLTACGSSGGTNASSNEENVNSDEANESADPVVLVDIADEPAGVNCFNGGFRIDTGIDNDSSGTLGPGEISETNFVCNGGWLVAEVIETDNTSNANRPEVAVASNGDSIAVWLQWDGVRNNVWVNRYIPLVGWGNVELIGPAVGVAPGDGASSPSIAMNTDGDAIVVWRHKDGGRNDIWANRYKAGVGWEGPVLIETDNTGSAWVPQVTVDDSGNAVAVWNQTDGTRDNIWANRYVVNSGWGTAELIETDNAGSAWGAQVSVDDSGNAIAVWNQYDGARDNAWANRYVAGTGWGTPELIESDNTGSVGSVKVAVDASGNAVAVWRNHDGVRSNIMANRYVIGTGWGSAELIETEDNGSASAAQVAVDDSGNAIAVWSQSDGTRSNIWANRYLVGTGWGIAELIETNNAGDAFMSQLAFDSIGNAVAVWHQHDSYRYNIWANRYIMGLGWGTASLIETDNDGNATEPQLGTDGNGNAMAVWFQDDGANLNIWANRFLAPGP